MASEVGLSVKLINAFVATRTPAHPGTADWAMVRSSLECELFARSVPIILREHASEMSGGTVRRCIAVLRGNLLAGLGPDARRQRDADIAILETLLHPKEKENG